MQMEEKEKLGRDRIIFWLVKMMHVYSSMNFTKFTELGIHPGQIPVLSMIAEHEGISLRELADTIHIKPPTVTVTVQRLEKNSLVCKKPDPADQRVARIYLTEKGEKIKQEIKGLFEENERILTTGFSEAELNQLRDYLKRMIDNMKN